MNHNVRFFSFLLSLICFFTFLPLATVAKTRENETAWIVVLGQFKKRSQADYLVAQYLAKGLPQMIENDMQYGYPRVELSSRMEGVQPGYWMAIAVMANDAKVANRFAEYLRESGEKASVQKVGVYHAKPVRLLILNPTLKYEGEYSAQWELIKHFTIGHLYWKPHQHLKNELGIRTLSKSRLNKNKRTMIPYYQDKNYKNRLFFNFYHDDPTSYCRLKEKEFGDQVKLPRSIQFGDNGLTKLFYGNQKIKEMEFIIFCEENSKPKE